VHPVLFHVAGEPVTSFSVVIMGACFVTAYVAGRACVRLGLPAKCAWRAYPVVLVAGILGARACFSLERALLDEHVSFVADFIANSGSTFHGGLFAGLAALLVKGALDGAPLGKLTAAWAPALAFGLAVGRIGCFLASDDYGVPTDLPRGFAFPQGAPPTSVPVHPTQLYESLWAFTVAAILWRRLDRSPALFAEFLILEGVGRFLVEIIRTNPTAIWVFSSAQIVAMAGALCGLVVLTHAKNWGTDINMKEEAKWALF